MQTNPFTTDKRKRNGKGMNRKELSIGMPSHIKEMA